MRVPRETKFKGKSQKEENTNIYTHISDRLLPALNFHHGFAFRTTDNLKGPEKVQSDPTEPARYPIELTSGPCPP